MGNLRIIACSGSLRKKSFNSALIRAIKKLDINGIEIIIFNDMHKIPLFNPDRELEIISAVQKLKNEIKISNAILIASPEYAHGISGVLKNALDWLVSGDEFPDKPILLCNTSPRASHGLSALREVLTTMSGKVIDSATITIPLLGTKLDSDGIIADLELSHYLIQQMTLFREKIRSSE